MVSTQVAFVRSRTPSQTLQRSSHRSSSANRVPDSVLLELRERRLADRVGIALGAAGPHGLDGATQNVRSDLP